MSAQLPTQQAAAGHVPSAVYTAAAQQAAPGQPVIVVQAPAPQRQPYGLYLAGGVLGGGVLVALLLSITVVAIAVAVCAVSLTVGWITVKQLMGGGR